MYVPTAGVPVSTIFVAPFAANAAAPVLKNVTPGAARLNVAADRGLKVNAPTVMGDEGLAVEALMAADIVMGNTLDALYLLEFPTRLVATLRR